jgi:hypothetical protein
MKPVKIKRRPGRPKGSKTKPKVPKVPRVVVNDDQQVAHLPLKEAVEHHHGQVSELEARCKDLGDSWETESLFEDIIEDLSDETSLKNGKLAFSFSLYIPRATGVPDRQKNSPPAATEIS